VSLQTDPDHCGACDDPCAQGTSCVEGACECPASLTRCGELCVATDSNPDHCGACDNGCGALGSACIDGICQCMGTAENCGNTCVDTLVDPDHCGECDRPCDPGENCAGGSCV
jgi:hypothetical protein